MFNKDVVKKIFLENKCNKQEACIFLLIYATGVKSREEIRKTTEFSSNVINRAVSKLLLKKLITVREDWQSKKFYCVVLNLYKKHKKCDKCANNDKRNMSKGSGKIKVSYCPKKSCAYNFDYMNISTIRMVNKVTKISGVVSGVSYNKDKYDALCSYYIKKHKLVNGVKSLNAPIVKRYIKECCSILKGIDGVNMAKDQAFYEYVDDLYKKAKLKNKSFVIEQLNNTERVVRFFINDKKTGKKRVIRKCSKNGIYCTYSRKNGKCELLDSGFKCTTKIINNMKKKYGEL